MDGNYAVLLTGDGCIHCKRMYPIVQELRDAGYKVYVFSTSDYPEIKAQITALDKDARPIGSGIPWFVIRSEGETVKVFRGFTPMERIKPHMKKPVVVVPDDPTPRPDYDL